MLQEEQENYIFIAHNAKGFDSHFIINEFQKREIPTDQNLEAIVDGTKIMGIYFRKIVIKDSCLFLPMRLEQFTKAFQLSELKKGFFPHKFNRPENYDYIGPYVDKEFYGYNYFSESKRREFLEFYNNAISNNLVFDFQKELHDYCWSDVQLLTEGCLTFSKLSRQSSKRSPNDPGICPFREKLTLASYCNYLYTRNFMPENTLGMLPANGFYPKSNISKSAEIYLKYMSENYGNDM